MWQNVYRQSPDGDRDILKNIMLAVFRILDKLHNIIPGAARGRP